VRFGGGPCRSYLEFDRAPQSHPEPDRQTTNDWGGGGVRSYSKPDWPGNHDRAGPFKSSPSRCGVLLPTFGAVPRPESVGAFHPAVTHAQLRITDPDLHYYYQSTPDDD